MNTFLTLLATFYVCDAMVAEDALDHADELRCAAAFETLKIGFLSDKEREALAEIGFARGAQTREAFLRFQAWEAGSADLVKLFRDEARTAVLSMR
jgi:hypothetical protein